MPECAMDRGRIHSIRFTITRLQLAALMRRPRKRRARCDFAINDSGASNLLARYLDDAAQLHAGSGEGCRPWVGARGWRVMSTSHNRDYVNSGLCGTMPH